MIDLLITHAAELITLADSPPPRRGPGLAELGLVRDGFVAVDGGRILGAGSMAALPAEWSTAAMEFDATGRCVLPGFVDPHTHVVYGGDRVGEFKQRLAGATYVDIARSGGGILSTVRATRAASVDDLVSSARSRLQRMLLCGTTTAEVKSGYGLTVADELKMLEAIRRLSGVQPVELVATFCGAHEVPPEYRGATQGYVGLVVEDMLPAVAHQGIARFCDVFCEEDVFDVPASRRILEAGKTLGLVPRLHADELAAGFGGAELAAAVGARTADHLVRASDAGLAAMAAQGVTAVLLPGTSFYLGLDAHARARRMAELGVPLALATDCNPGSCPIESMAVVIGLACLLYRLTPAEALVAATLNAAWAVGLHDRVGSLAPGKQADLVVLVEPSHESLPYRFGTNLVEAVWKQGRRVV